MDQLQQLLTRRTQAGIPAHLNKVQEVAAAIISYDELLGLIESSQHIGYFEKYELRHLLHDALRKSLRGY